ncbi:lasso peptide biosynthesis B2 protein [Thalassospira sp. HJ]|uniref:lasso peptide biosynthesis B2 protein n=1 Tax=Thalassospira sp. HJ TaxID=1616823 RepID=UPI0009E37607
MDGRRRFLMLEAAFRLVVTWLIITGLPYSRIVPRHGACRSAAEGVERDLSVRLMAEQQLTVQEIRWAIDVAVQHLPINTLCLHQAMVGQRMLRWRKIPSVLFYGLKRDCPVSEFETHAWLVAGQCPVTGYPQAARFDAFASFW